jgi:hypothetical protein
MLKGSEELLRVTGIKGSVPHIHISKDLGGGWEPAPQLSGAATISLCSAALREDLGWGRRRFRA